MSMEDIEMQDMAEERREGDKEETNLERDSLYDRLRDPMIEKRLCGCGDVLGEFCTSADTGPAFLTIVPVIQGLGFLKSFTYTKSPLLITCSRA